MGRPPHPCVGVGHRVPHRVDGKGRGHLELGSPLAVCQPRSRGRPTPRRARWCPRWSSRRAYCSQLCRGHESSSSRASVARSRAARNRRGRCRPSCAATEYGGCAAACSPRANAARHGRNARRHRRAPRPRCRSSRSTASTATRRGRAHALGDRRIGLVDQALGSAPDRLPPTPPSLAPIAFSPLPISSPARCARAPARCSHGSASASRPVSTQNLPYAGGAEDEQVVVELAAVGRPLRWRRSPAPTAGPTARAGRRRRARWHTECGHK